jgi:hypothetical protein
MDAAKRRQREEQRRTDRAERDAAAAEDRAIEKWFQDVQRAADSVMSAAGFHKHHGQWRKKRQ